MVGGGIGKIDVSGGNVNGNITTTSYYEPVRGPRVRADIGSDKIKGGRTDFEYINYIELEGSLWKVITNRAAKSNAVEFLDNLVKECN